MLNRLKKRRVQANRAFTVVVTEFRKGLGTTRVTSDDTYEEYPFDAYCALTKRRKHGIRSVECIEVGAARSKMSLTDVHKEMRPGTHIVEPIEDTEREAILRALWRLTGELYRDARVFGRSKQELWGRVISGFILGKSLPIDHSRVTQKEILKDELYFETPEDT